MMIRCKKQRIRQEAVFNNKSWVEASPTVSRARKSGRKSDVAGNKHKLASAPSRHFVSNASDSDLGNFSSDINRHEEVRIQGYKASLPDAVLTELLVESESDGSDCETLDNTQNTDPLQSVCREDCTFTANSPVSNSHSNINSLEIQNSDDTSTLTDSLGDANSDLTNVSQPCKTSCRKKLRLTNDKSNG